MSNPPLIFIVFIFVIVVAILLGYFFSKKQRILREISKFKAKDIQQFRVNELTKVSGKILEVETPFIAPLSKRKCVAYIFEVERQVKSGKSSHWQTLVKKEDIQEFFIEKRGELVMIKPSKTPSNYDIYMEEDKKASSGTFNDPSLELQKVLDNFGVEATNWIGFNKTLRYTERILEIGETITVGGIAKWKNLPSDNTIKGYNYSKIAALESTVNQKIIITDHPNAVEHVGKRF